jgi:hypothetical protein
MTERYSKIWQHAVSTIRSTQNLFYKHFEIILSTSVAHLASVAFKKYFS